MIFRKKGASTTSASPSTLAILLAAPPASTDIKYCYLPPESKWSYFMGSVEGAIGPIPDTS